MTAATRHAHAIERFPSAIRKAMADRGMRQVELARLMHVRPTTISEWCRGTRFPSMEQAAGLAEHLLSDELAAIIATGHTVACVVCDREVVQTKRTRHPRYCSAACKATHHDRVRRNSTAQEGLIAKRRLTMYQEAVAGYCRECTLGEGVCRDDGCDLRSVSPLPFVPISRLGRRAA